MTIGGNENEDERRVWSEGCWWIARRWWSRVFFEYFWISKGIYGF
jgi:hypothetical protein